MKLTKYLFLTILLILTIRCNSEDDGGSPIDPLESVNPPLAANLIFPFNNETCFEGNVISKTESIVGFKWSSAENTDAYTLNITNLNTSVLLKVEVTGNEKDITILRGIPYSWFVTSKSNKSSKIAQSSIWKFYNAGIGLENHPPFPAEVLNPKMGSSVQSGNIQLKWTATDVENDITKYDIYLDTISPPLVPISTQQEVSLNIDVLGGKVYYWKVVTHDQEANTSVSQIFEFKTQ
jgi:hypothetical protein